MHKSISLSSRPVSNATLSNFFTNLTFHSRLVKSGSLTDNSKLILQRVQFLSNLGPKVAVGTVNDSFLNEKTQKKMFFPNIFMNSEEFKDLGNLHYERRQVDYPPEEVSLQELARKRMMATDSDFYKQLSAGAAPTRTWK